MSDKLYNWSKKKTTLQKDWSELDSWKKFSLILPITECFAKFAKKIFKNHKIPLRKVLLVTLRNEV